MKYYCAETLEEVKIVRDHRLLDEPTFNVYYQNGHISYYLEKRHIEQGFFKSKKNATIAFNKHIKHRIKFHQEEIAKLVEVLVC